MVGVTEEQRAEGSLGARECDPWAQNGRVTAESRKRQVGMRAKRTQNGAVLTVRGRGRVGQRD